MFAESSVKQWGGRVVPLYTAPPAAVVPEFETWFNSQESGRSICSTQIRRSLQEISWNACRAVMLQSGNFREIAETSTNSPVIPSEVLSAILKFARVRADFDDFDGDRRGIGDCLDETEHELIVTINKYASQLAVVLVGLDERAAFNAWNNEENLPIAGVSAKNAAWLAWQARAELGRSLAVNSPVTPDGWVMVPKRLTTENGAKGALSGEFSETTFISCLECFGDDDCDTCDGSGRIEIKVPVTWSTIKSIWDKGIEYFAAKPSQEVK